MYRELFPGDHSLRIEWFAYEEPSGRCQTDEFFQDMPPTEKAKLEAQMVAWSRHGRWEVRVNYVHLMEVPDGWPAVYVIKIASGYRLYFVRCRNDAVSVMGMLKKAMWGKKDQKKFLSAEALFKAAAAECNGAKK